MTACQKQAPVKAAKESGPISVESAIVKTREIQRTIDSVGTLFPYDETVISAEIEGRVNQVNVDLGDAVNQDQILVRISDEEQRYMVQQQEAALRQSLERLGLKSENDKVADIRETPDVRRVQADLFEAQQNYNRKKLLMDQNIGSRSDLDQASARLQSAQASYDSMLNQTRNLIQEVERVKAMLALQRKKLRDTTVRAPVKSYVKDRQVNVGQYVQARTPLLSLVQIDPIRLRVEVPERMAPWVKTGQLVDVTVEAFEDRKFQGKIWRISPTVDQTKRTFIAEALISNPDGRLKPGSYARARIPTDKVEKIKLVPTRSVYYVLGSNKAYIIGSDNMIDAREVKLGDRFQQEVEIIEGVNDGDRVATTQLMKLDTGSKVKVVEGKAQAPAPPAGGQSD